MTRSSIVAVLLTGMFEAASCWAAQAQPEVQSLAGKITCGPFSSAPQKFPAWQDDLTIKISQGALVAQRSLTSQPGQEFLRGVVAPSGAILIIGDGGYENGRAAWVYEFSGKWNPKGATLLKGKLVNTKGAVGARDCSLSF